VAVGQTAPIGIVLKDSEGRVLPLGGDAPYAVEARVAAGDESAAGIDVDGATVEFEGKAVGEAEIVFEIYHSGELVYDTAPDLATLEVVEEIDEESQFYDPHTWIDPVIAQEMVTKIGEEFAGFDPDNAETYRDNAASYNGRIAAVDEQIREVVGDAELDVAIFAGHDSYQYVERRYGFELKTPVGVSPDAQVAIDDIIGLVETVEKNGIDTILYDPFEAASPGDGYPQVVERILEESSATETAPLTPLSGTTEEWEENGWGWVGQMEQINIPSLEQALNPS
jgi:zinc transport system substrate-binding protein